MNCYIILSPKLFSKQLSGDLWQLKCAYFTKTDTMWTDSNRRKFKNFNHFTLICSWRLVLILFEAIFKSVLNILCIMLNSLLNRYITLEKKVSKEAQHSQNNHCRTQQWHHLTCLMISTNLFDRRLVRCFKYIMPLWSAVDHYQHLSVRRKAWNTPSPVTDWNQKFDQKQQLMSVTFMTW